MNILIISDLHIDNGDNFGSFGWKPKKFIKTLEKIIEFYRVDNVVLNGDVFDLYKYSFSDVNTHNQELIQYFREKNFVFIRGNHDLLNPFARNSLTIKNSKGQRIHIEHGHEADFLNGTRIGSVISKMGFFLLKILVRIKWVERIYFKIVEYDDEVNRVPRKYNSYKYLKYALKLLRTFDVVVLGHTHKLESFKTYYLNNKKKYLNCGTCSLGRFQAIIINTESLKYETIKISKKDKINYSDLPKTSSFEYSSED